MGVAHRSCCRARVRLPSRPGPACGLAAAARARADASAHSPEGLWPGAFGRARTRPFTRLAASGRRPRPGLGRGATAYSVGGLWPGACGPGRGRARLLSRMVTCGGVRAGPGATAYSRGGLSPGVCGRTRAGRDCSMAWRLVAGCLRAGRPFIAWRALAGRPHLPADCDLGSPRAPRRPTLEWQLVALRNLGRPSANEVLPGCRLPSSGNLLSDSVSKKPGSCARPRQACQ